MMNSVPHDPVIIAAGVVFAATAGILAWILKSWRDQSSIADETFDDEIDLETPPPSSNQASGLLEAHFQELTCQLTNIDKRLNTMEAAAQQKNSAEQAALPADLAKLVQGFEARLADLSAKGTSTEDELRRIEGKLEGIHKLLIILTDSGSNPDQR